MISYFLNGLEDKLTETTKLQSVFMKAATSLASIVPFQVPVSAVKVVHQHQEVRRRPQMEVLSHFSCHS
jgi:hypothetical protein